MEIFVLRKGLSVIVLCVCIVLFMVSCQYNQSESYTAIDVEKMETLNRENFISQDEILNSASDIYEKILEKSGSGGNELRSNSPDNKLSGSAVNNISSFSDNRNTAAFYAVDFEEGGYIVLSADKRAPDVLAFSVENPFLLEDGEMPPGLTVWIDEMKNAISAVRYNAVNDKKTDDRNNVVTYSGNSEGSGGSSSSTLANASYLVQTTWGQANGYNDSLPECSPGQKMKSGCATVAIVQLLKYHQYPNIYNWSSMANSYATPETARLYKDFVTLSLATPNGCSSTSTYIDRARRTLAYFGFTNTYDSFDLDCIKSNLELNRPVLILQTISEGGHLWICDGYCQVGSSDYLHCNWGWYGNYNGWFISNTNWVVSYTFPANTRDIIYNIYQTYTYPYSAILY